MSDLPRRDERITIEHAFYALHYFVEAYWKRVGQPAELSYVLSDTQILRGNLKPADPAMWSDFLEAVDKAREEGPPFLTFTKE